MTLSQNINGNLTWKYMQTPLRRLWLIQQHQFTRFYRETDRYTQQIWKIHLGYWDTESRFNDILSSLCSCGFNKHTRNQTHTKSFCIVPIVYQLLSTCPYTLLDAAEQVCHNIHRVLDIASHLDCYSTWGTGMGHLKAMCIQGECVYTMCIPGKSTSQDLHVCENTQEAPMWV